MPLRPIDASDREAVRWLTVGGLLGLVYGFLRELLRASDEPRHPLLLLARALVNAAFGVGVAVAALHVATLGVLDLVGIAVLVSYLGSEYALAFLEGLVRWWLGKGHGSK